MKRQFIFVTYLFAINLLMPRHVNAYIDPGTGSYIFQIIAASVLTVLFSLKNLRNFISSLFKRVFKHGPKR